MKAAAALQLICPVAVFIWAISTLLAAEAPTPLQQAYLKASNTGGAPNEISVGDEFGYSVAISGDTIAVAASLEDSDATGVNGDQTNDNAEYAGAVYVFVRSGTNWIQQAYLKASNTGAGDAFGESLALDGDTLIVGASYEDSSTTGVNGNQSNNDFGAAGAAYVFVRTGTNWTQQAYLKASNSGAQDHFGWSVALSGDTAVVGAYLEASGATGVNGDQNDNGANGAGAAYVFVRDGTNWTQQAYLKASNTGNADRFGRSVGVSGNVVVVGAPNEDSNAIGVNGNQSNNSAANAGAAYIFVRNGTNWAQQVYLKASDVHANDQFGYSVAVLGETVAVGARFAPADGDGGGAVYVFGRDGTNWAEQAYLKASNPGQVDVFGSSLSMSGEAMVVGAYEEDSDATGVNGDQTNNNAYNSGAAYVFVRNNTNWVQQAYLKASNPGFTDEFAFSVSMSGNTVVVGAPFESSNATGVNGDQSDNSAVYSGAAYVFAGFAFGPRLTLMPDGSSGYFVRFNAVTGDTYQLQRTTNLSDGWSTNATISALSSGLAEFHDTNAPVGKAFYRVVRE